MRPVYLIAGLVIAVGIIALVRFWPIWFAEEPPVVPVETSDLTPPAELIEPLPIVEPPTSAEPQDPPEPPLPGLNESDSYVLERLSGYDLPATWLEKDDLLRRVATVIENAARGTYPRRQLGFLAPSGPFAVLKEGDTIIVDPKSYDRYDRYLNVLERLEPNQTARLLQRVEPLLTQALGELGVKAESLVTLQVAIDELLAVPVLEGSVLLLRPKVLYQYADPALEGLSDLQKQVLRMGPKNVARLHSYLAALREGLSIR